MLVIFNNRIKISGGRFDQEEEEESSLTASRLSRDSRRERRDSKTTKVFVSNGRLTFQLASDIPPSPGVGNSTGSSVTNVC